MISDEEVRRAFRKQLDAPDVVAGILRMSGQNAGYQFGKNITLQIERGIPAYRWKNVHTSGCLRHFAVFNLYKAISGYCMDCYKVLVEPRTAVDLFRLLLIDEKLVLPLNNTRKYTVEARPHCSGAYKVFFYCRGMEDGKEVQRIVQEAVSGHVSSAIPVKLKRGCSEFAQAYPDYAQLDKDLSGMEYAKDWKFYEEFVDANVLLGKIEAGESDNPAPDPANEVFAMQYWLKYAATIGDKSYLNLTGGRTVQPIPNLRRP